MSTIVTIHSFRRGVGKTSLVSSLAVLLAKRGRRVALIDTDFQSPGVHLFFGIPDPECAFNDYLWGKCDILSVARDVTSQFAGDAAGGLFILPASSKISDILQSIRIPRNIDHYAGGLDKLKKELSLDVILVDAPAGLNESTLQAIAVSNTVVLVLHPDKGDFQGTAVTVDMIRRLQVPIIHLVLNDAPETLDVEDAARQLEETYHCGGGIVLKHSEELMALSSARPFALQYPSHPLTTQLDELAERLSV
ncbi:MAG: MinD/ParA family protein [Chloroflexi bacterium]|nr:MinD/ParA family protein [Chloroflexota bacterium]